MTEQVRAWLCNSGNAVVCGQRQGDFVVYLEVSCKVIVLFVVTDRVIYLFVVSDRVIYLSAVSGRVI